MAEDSGSNGPNAPRDEKMTGRTKPPTQEQPRVPSLLERMTVTRSDVPLGLLVKERVEQREAQEPAYAEHTPAEE